MINNTKIYDLAERPRLENVIFTGWRGEDNLKIILMGVIVCLHLVGLICNSRLMPSLPNQNIALHCGSEGIP